MIEENLVQTARAEMAVHHMRVDIDDRRFRQRFKQVLLYRIPHE